VFGGTVYTSGGTTADPGIWVTVTPTGGTAMTIATDTAGNFHFEGSTAFAAGSSDVDVCPNGATPMSDQTTAGNCNNSACHGTGGNPGPIIGM
jgi:hypothetical protein